MIDCQQALIRLYEYMDREIDQEGTLEIKAHIELCRACFDCYEFEKILREHMKNKTNHCCPEKLKARIVSIVQTFEQK